MGVLANPRHEAFAQARASGLEGKEAWLKARPGAARSSAYSQSCRLSKDPAILQRIAELTAKADAIIAKAIEENVQQEARTIARIVGAALTQAEMLAFLTNAVLTPIGQLDANNMLTHSIETTGSPGPDAKDLPVNKLKAHDKLRAIELLARLQGMLVEKVEQTVDDKRVKPPDERARLLRESIARRHATGGSS